MRNYKLGIITAMALAAALPERKLTKELLEGEVKEKHFTRIGDRITHCRIVTHSGFEFTGESAVVDAKNFDEKLGEQYAYEQALDGMWMPYGFWLHKALAEFDNLPTNTAQEEFLQSEKSVLGSSVSPKTERLDKDAGVVSGIRLDEQSKSEDLLAVSAVNPTVDIQEQHQEPTMDFGYAVKMMKNGKRVSRIGWNGKGMFLYYVPENKYPASRNEHGTMIGVFEDDMVPYGAYIAMKTAQNNVVPWLASQTDVLAEDWVIV